MARDVVLDVRTGATVGALLGALVEVGASLRGIETDLGALGPGAVPIALRHARIGAGVRVHAPRDASPLRRWGQQRDRLALLALDAPVVEVALVVSERLARARAEIRGVPLDQVDCDQFAGLDELAGAVALGSALASLGSPTVLTTAVGVGSGTVETAFGTIPAVGELVDTLLREHRRIELPVAAELVDPVAAAFLGAASTQLPPAFEQTLDAVEHPGGALPGPGVGAQTLVGRGAVHTREGGVGTVFAYVDGPPIGHAASVGVAATQESRSAPTGRA